MTDIASARDRSTKSSALKAFGWLWFVVIGIAGIAIMSTTSVMGGLAYVVSALFAAPPSWRLLTQHGIQASRKMKALGVFGASALGGLILATTTPFTFDKLTSKANVASPAASAPSVDAPANCEGIKGTPEDFAVLEGGELRERADARSAQVSMSFGVEQEERPISIDPTMPVREMCRSGKWSYVSILQLPSDIGKAKGWVPTASLRPVKTDTGGRRIYEAADFDWPEGSTRHRKAILTVLNRVMAQNPRCDAFNSQSLLMEEDRAGPLIKVACFGEPEQIVEFRPDDATNSRSFAPVSPINQTSARNACQQAIMESATHPSTVEISMFDGRFRSSEDGTAVYQTSFSARNGFNLTLSYAITCAFKGAELAAVEVHETGR